MAGTRHHFIPKFLQRGFCSHVVRHQSKDDDYYAWVFRKGRTYNANIKNISVEGQFYALGDDASVDDKITNAEGPMAEFVGHLRTCPDGSEIDSQAAAKLIAHIAVRTRHIRQNFLNTGGHLVSKLLDAFSNPTILEAAFRRRLANDPNFLKDELAEQVSTVLKVAGVPQERLPEGVAMLLPQVLAKAPAMFSDVSGAVATMSQAVRSALGTLPGKLVEAAKTGHLQVLDRALAPPTQVEALTQLTYCVKRFEENNLILGDSAVIYIVNSHRRVVPFYDSLDPLLGVILPIASDACLLGTAPGVGSRIQTTTSLREAVAECSLEYFIGRVDGLQNAVLTERLDSNSYILSDEDIASILAEWI
jgi:hypothetical protein